jgi:cytoskeletal protein RodZ
MEFVGEYLKSIRIKKKWTIEELSYELKINQNLIAKIELDDFSEYLSPVYLMGYIRSYANFFDLNADDLIETFKIQTSYSRLHESRAISKPIRVLSLMSYTKTFYFASIFIISTSFYFMFVKPNNLDLEYAMTPDLPENLEYDLEEIEMNLSLSRENKKNLKNFSSKNNEIIKKFEFESNLSNFSSALASTSEDIFIRNNDKITLRFLNPTWIQLRDSQENIIISQLMNESDEYSYNLLENLNLTAGNCGNIIVSVNGVVKGKLGKAGDVIESFIIDKNFTN